MSEDKPRAPETEDTDPMAAAPRFRDRAPAPATVGGEAQKAADELAAYYRSLAPADRFAAAFCATLLVLLAMPWATTRAEGTLIGFFAGAWPAGALAAGMLVFIYLRVSRGSRQNELLLRLGQLAAAAVLTLFCALFVRDASVSATVHAGARTAAAVRSTPEWGAFGGALCAVLALLGTIQGFFAKR